jgi:S-adenosyl-L-methionine hydrolase (adenosine-forming)
MAEETRMNIYNRGMFPHLEDWITRSERPPIITMTTDFGQYDGYVGTMKGVIHTLLPNAKVVDISHDIAPHQINEGAFIVYRAYRYFPAGAVHIAVVDPGVGSSRRPIVLVTRHGTFVGPDNGIFTYVLRAELTARHDESPGAEAESEQDADADSTPTELSTDPAWAGGMWGVAPNWEGDEPVSKRSRTQRFRSAGGTDLPRAYHLDNPNYWLRNVSNTFHGRDIFAPVAAHLASGAQADRIGSAIPLQSLVRLPIGAPRVHRSGPTVTVVGQIVHIDRFGNIITNLPERLLAPILLDKPQPTIEVGAHVIKGLARAYTDVREGQPVALIGSEGLLEIAVRNSNAAHRMKVRTGDPVRIVVVDRKS